MVIVFNWECVIKLIVNMNVFLDKMDHVYGLIIILVMEVNVFNTILVKVWNGKQIENVN